MPFAMSSPPNSLRVRLLRVFVGGMALSAGLVAIGAMLLARPFGEFMLRSSVEHFAKDIGRVVEFDASGRPVGFDGKRLQPWLLTSFGPEVLVRVLDGQGRVALAFGPGTQPLAPEGGRFDPAARGFPMTREGVAMHASTTALHRDGRTWYVQFAASDRLVLTMRNSFGLTGLWQGIAAICGTFFLVFLVTFHMTLRRALQPLDEASRAAAAITPRTLDARLDVRSQPGEIRPLVEGFNQALERLQAGFRAQQEFLSCAAHELKTPLALVRAQIERGTEDASRRLLLQDVDRMGRQVQQLLLLAEVSEVRNFRIERLDPRPVVQEAFDYMDRVAEGHAVQLLLRIAPTVVAWQVDRGALFTLLKNLLENAIQHSPEGGVVTLAVDAAGFSVCDEGCGVLEEHLPRIFDRFWKGAARREEGAGLGLAICREIVLAHGWTLAARNRAKGLEVQVMMAPAGAPGV